MKLWLRLGTLALALLLIFACGHIKAPGRLESLEEQVEPLARDTEQLRKDVDRLTESVLVLQAKVEANKAATDELRDELATVRTPVIEEPLETTPAPAPAPVPEFAPEQPPAVEEFPEVRVAPPPEELYEQASATLRAGSYNEAISLYREFLANYPTHRLANNAQYWIGECYYVQKDFPSAILAFKGVVDNYPTAPKVPDALLKMGYAYISMGDKANARDYLERVVKYYPKSSAARLASDKLQGLR